MLSLNGQPGHTHHTHVHKRHTFTNAGSHTLIESETHTHTVQRTKVIPLLIRSLQFCPSTHLTHPKHPNCTLAHSHNRRCEQYNLKIFVNDVRDVAWQAKKIQPHEEFLWHPRTHTNWPWLRHFASQRRLSFSLTCQQLVNFHVEFALKLPTSEQHSKHLLM